MLRPGNCHIGNRHKKLPFSPTRFATLKLGTVPVTEDREQKATVPVPFPDRRIEERCWRSFSFKKSCSSLKPGASHLRKWNGSGGFFSL
jgi:hypothetical protein